MLPEFKKLIIYNPRKYNSYFYVKVRDKISAVWWCILDSKDDQEEILSYHHRTCSNEEQASFYLLGDLKNKEDCINFHNKLKRIAKTEGLINGPGEVTTLAPKDWCKRRNIEAI